MTDNLEDGKKYHIRTKEAAIIWDALNFIAPARLSDIATINELREVFRKYLYEHTGKDVYRPQP